MSKPQPHHRSAVGDGTDPPARDLGLESTQDLLDRVRSGDAAAREALVARYLPALRRFAHGRLPARARSVLDTDDLVQDTILRALNRLDAFEPEHRGSLLAYLRQILLNRVRDEARRVVHFLRSEAPSPDLPDPAPSPIEEAIGHEVLARYERALADLPADCQEAIMLRIEMGCGYAEIAEVLGRSSANAARLHTKRALLKLIERLGSLQDPP
jgi:RNA polymerase sigma-70 factor (ECF subfamily)